MQGTCIHFTRNHHSAWHQHHAGSYSIIVDYLKDCMRAWEFHIICFMCAHVAYPSLSSVGDQGQRWIKRSPDRGDPDRNSLLQFWPLNYGKSSDQEASGDQAQFLPIKNLRIQSQTLNRRRHIVAKWPPLRFLVGKCQAGFWGRILAIHPRML